MNKQLPDFTNPPVVEVVLGVQFDELTGLGHPQMGLWWAKIRDRFPKIEEHLPLEIVQEVLGRVPPKREIRVVQTEKPPVFRWWYVNESGTELLQLQPQWFIHNWRKGEQGQYPRFKHVRDTFESEIESFRHFLKNEGLGEIVPNQAEVTYVNHIVSGNSWHSHGELDKVLTLFSGTYSDEFLPKVEGASLGARYVMPDPDGRPIGRLHLSVEPAFRKSDNQPLYVLKLTARGLPIGGGFQGVHQFFEVGHEWIVRAFASITRPEMHKIWERTNGL